MVLELRNYLPVQIQWHLLELLVSATIRERNRQLFTIGMKSEEGDILEQTEYVSTGWLDRRFIFL